MSQPINSSKITSDASHAHDWTWHLWPLVPIYPYGKRRTLRIEVLNDRIWTFDQVQGIFYVVVPIRMTVVRLDAGGLLVYAPVAPTPECLRLMQELVDKYGAVRYIILPTVSGIEHKVFVGPFARHFPTAQVYVSPHQWSFPLNLPLSWLGLPPDRTHILPADSRQTPFGDEIDYAVLGAINLNVGAFAEVAMVHRPTHTLLLTDMIVSVPEEPPAIVQLDPYPLLFHAKDHASEVVADTPANRRKGWHRISLFAFYFRPSVLDTLDLGQTVLNALKAVDRSRKAYFGLYPFRWQPNWHYAFQALCGHSRPFVAPVLQQLILNRAPQTTLAWVDRVAQWEFNHIIPCHFMAPIPASPRQFRQAFAFLDPQATGDRLPDADVQLLRELEAGLVQRKILPPV
ncbi:MAG: DUF4336 domain-containing protein [Cyanobacteria bacterium]|nr:DUF4336 domain-containing protein [Cyanobacteriota bacterium]MDW8201559.1 DUF4336 domain-containing protein [Cyanobacteriota bacterium SKYGB_h_bin112]